jgi:hypothetical protein
MIYAMYVLYPNKSHNKELNQLKNITPKIVLIVPYLRNELKAIFGAEFRKSS